MFEEKKYPGSSLSQCYLAVLINTVLIFLLFIWFAYTRNVDGDEGIYLEAARLISQGKKLYFDFFFNQMPLTPYLYAGWMKIFGFTLYSGRWLSVLLTALAGMACLIYIARRTNNLFWIGIGTILYCANGLILGWAPVIKTHPLNIFSLTVSSVLLLEWRRLPQKPLWMIAVAGLTIGIGVNGRLTLSPFVLFYFVFILIFGEGRRWVSLFAFVLAFLVASIPVILYFISDPHQFLKYNLVFHTKVYPGVADFAFREKIAKDFFTQPQSLLLVLLAYGGLLRASQQGWKAFLRSDEFFIWILILVFLLIHLGTATPFTQYFSAVMPLFLLATVPLMELLSSRVGANQFFILSPILLFYVFTVFPLLYFELYSVGSLHPAWRLKNIDFATSYIKRLVKEDQECLTWWPGYAFLSGCKSVPGMENHMRGHALNERVPGEVLEQYKMLSDEGIIQGLSERKYPWVIDGVYRLETPFSEYTEYLLQENYRLKTTIRGIKLYVPKPPEQELNDNDQQSALKTDAKEIKKRARKY